MSHNNDDVEVAAPPASPPVRNVRFSSSTKKTAESPGIETVGSDTTTGSKLTIHHAFSGTPTSSGSRAILGMSRPVAAIAATLLMGTVGAGIWGWIQIPGLNNQIKKLESQVNRLQAEVDRLETEVDRLEVQNDRFELLNGELNQTVIDLRDVNEDLRSTATSLEESVNELNSTVGNLEKINQNLTAENERFANLNQELGTIVAFLNETAIEFNETYESLTSYLAEQIVANRVLVLQTLENLYTQQVLFWDCSFRDVFRGENFILNEDLVIGSQLPSVLEYVEERVLSELCLNASDFESFLDSRYSLDLFSANQLYQGVALYSNAALDYYFPDPGEAGLTADVWSKSNYRCENVTKFRFSG